MAYITIEYYKTTFLGTDPGDDTELARLIERSSDMVDLMTDRKSQDYDDLEDYQQTAIQKATAYQTEYLVENGDTFSEDMASSEKIGSWSRSGAGAAASGGSKMFSKVAESWLMQNGLMSSVIGITDGNSETYIC